MEWLTAYSGKLIGGLVAILTSSVVIQIAPIQVNPWTWLFRKFGEAINGDVREKLDQISNDLSAHIREDDQRDAKRARVRILRFSDEIVKQEHHSREHFCEVLEDITAYKRYCLKHPEFPNDKANLSIAHIERTYKERLEKDDFL